MNEDCKDPVKASELIAKLQEGGIAAEVTEEGDAAPYLWSVSVNVDEAHRCSLKGWLAYHEDDVKSGVDEGVLSATVLGVEFTRSLIYDDGDIEIAGGREIEYDSGLTEDDVLEAAREGIDFPDYDPDNYQFDEDAVTDEDIIQGLMFDGFDYEIFALDADGALCAFESADEVPAEGYEILDEDDALDRLARDRPGLTFDFP